MPYLLLFFSCFIIFMKGTDRTFMHLVSVQRVCGSTPLNLTHAWWPTFWPTVANLQWHPATPFGGCAVIWALPKPLFGLMGDCFIYLFIYSIVFDSLFFRTSLYIPAHTYIYSFCLLVVYSIICLDGNMNSTCAEEYLESKQ